MTNSKFKFNKVVSKNSTFVYLQHNFGFVLDFASYKVYDNTLKNKYKDKGCSTIPNKTAIDHRKKKAYTLGCTL